jgi:hypothetical protein
MRLNDEQLINSFALEGAGFSLAKNAEFSR